MTLARLQLAVGAAAQLIEECPPDGSRRIFAARAPTAPPDSPPSRVVVLHPPPPEGPTAGAMLDRMAAIRAVGHPGVASPLATGSLDGCAWVVEPVTGTRTLAVRMHRDGGLSVHETVRLLRDVTRALAMLHRRRIAHGALNADAIVFTDDAVALHTLGRTVASDPLVDLRALGALGTAAMGRAGAARRSQPPAALQELLSSLVTTGISTPPLTADRVLEALDVFPARSASRSAAILDEISRGARAPAQRRVAVMVAAITLLVLVAWLWLR